MCCHGVLYIVAVKVNGDLFVALKEDFASFVGYRKNRRVQIIVLGVVVGDRLTAVSDDKLVGQLERVARELVPVS